MHHGGDFSSCPPSHTSQQLHPQDTSRSDHFPSSACHHLGPSHLCLCLDLAGTSSLVLLPPPSTFSPSSTAARRIPLNRKFAQAPNSVQSPSVAPHPPKLKSKVHAMPYKVLQLSPVPLPDCICPHFPLASCSKVSLYPTSTPASKLILAPGPLPLLFPGRITFLGHLHGLLPHLSQLFAQSFSFLFFFPV